MKSFLFFCLIGQLAALDRSADPAVELRTVEGAVVGFGVELVLVHGIGGVEVYQHKVGVIARLQLTLGKAQDLRRAVLIRWLSSSRGSPSSLQSLV